MVVNARCDILIHAGGIDEVVSRGKRYLEAGATTVFVWAAGRGISTGGVKHLVKVFDGRLSVFLKQDGLSFQQLAHIGVARISVGPRLMSAGLAAYRNAAEAIFS